MEQTLLRKETFSSWDFFSFQHEEMGTLKEYSDVNHVMYFYILHSFWDFKWYCAWVREAFNKKKTVKLGEKSKPPGPPPPPNLGTLNCYFFIDYLDFMDHEMDFESNLFFSLTKVVWHLRFSAILYLMVQEQTSDYSKCQPCVYFVFWVLLSIF